MQIITRAQWGARNAASPGGDRVSRSKRTDFFMHYSLGEELRREDTAEWVREIQAFHMGPQRGWADIGYNFLVDKFGNIFEGRGWDRAGAHCPGHNTTGLGLCFMGDDDPEQDFTAAAQRAARELYDEACKITGNKLGMKGHRDGKSTACPGDEIYAWVRAGMPAPGGVIVPPPGPVPKPQPPVPGPAAYAPPFPLPRGWYFGPKSGPRESVSGYHSHREDLRRWQQRMRDRGWQIDVDGLYGPGTASVAGKFQAEKGLSVDGLIGAQTWAAAWLAPVR
jgi:peptidoglycan hydrolase-like protein with peptidoglycan-binding domain